MYKILGIVPMDNPEVKIEGLGEYRPTSVISFMGRYRLIDIPISNFSTSGINQIQVYIHSNARSVIEHTANISNYNINSKHGKLHLLTANTSGHMHLYNNDINGYLDHLYYISGVAAQYIVIAPAHALYRADFQDLVQQHVDSGRDISMLYSKRIDGDDAFKQAKILDINNDNLVERCSINLKTEAHVNAFLDSYILSKNTFIKIIKEGGEQSRISWFSDIIQQKIIQGDIGALEVPEAYAYITDLKSYYDASLRLNNPEVFKRIMDNTWHIYTQTNDSPPTYYGDNANVDNSCIANGSHIDGSIHNSIIGRGCRIGKNAKIINSIISGESVVEENAIVENSVIDKRVIVTKNSKVLGNNEAVTYIRKGDVV